MSTVPPQIQDARDGALLGGRYRIVKHLATGGMADLYLARAIGIAGFERHVVIKRIKAEHARDDRFVHMFLDEARLAAQLHHQNIAQVYDIGEDQGFYFAMEYVHGENVREILKKVALLRRQIPIEHALTISAGAAAGLHYAHEKRGNDRQPLGIVHRDVSPSNLLVAYDGAVKVVDFGIAKAAVRMGETRSGTLKGKVAYMSPEQFMGGEVDRRSDVFALGVVMWELTTVSRLFRGDNDYITMHRIATGDVPRPSTRRADYPAALEAVVMKSLALKVEDRFASVGDMLTAIEEVAAKERLSLSPLALGRYIRELFGEKPEPWLALADDGDSMDVVDIEIERGTPDVTRPSQLAPPVTPQSQGSLLLASTSVPSAPARRGVGWFAAGAGIVAALGIGVLVGQRGRGEDVAPVATPPAIVEPAVAPAPTPTPVTATAVVPVDAGVPDAAPAAAVVPESAPAPGPESAADARRRKRRTRKPEPPPTAAPAAAPRRDANALFPPTD